MKWYRSGNHFPPLQVGENYWSDESVLFRIYSCNTPQGQAENPRPKRPKWIRTPFTQPRDANVLISTMQLVFVEPKKLS